MFCLSISMVPTVVRGVHKQQIENENDQHKNVILCPQNMNIISCLAVSLGFRNPTKKKNFGSSLKVLLNFW